MTQCDGWRRSPAHGLFWGLLLIVGGGLFLMRNLGMLNFDIGAYWPVILIAMGVSQLLRRVIGPKSGL